MPEARQPRRSARRSDDVAIVDLIAGVRSARINLTADLSAAAGALDAGELEVAREILDAEQAELVAFVSDAKQALGAGAVSTSVVPAPRRPRRTRSRVLIALPAIPLVGALAMTAAAAINAGDHRATAENRTTSSASATAALAAGGPNVQPTAADTTLHRLEHVVTHHPRAGQVLAVANDLHAQLTQMIASSNDNPAQLVVIRHLLVLEQRVLEVNKAPGAHAALAASRAIAHLLELVPTPQPSAHPTSAPTPTQTQTQPPRNYFAPTSAPTSPAPTASTPKPTPSKHHRPASPTATSHPKKKSKKSRNPLFGPGVFNIFR